MVSLPTGALIAQHIAITRPVDQAKKLCTLIEQAGGTAILFPLIEIAPLNDYSKFNAVISHIEDYDWAIFISSNAVQNSMPRLIQQLGRIPPNLQFSAIGPVTAKDLKGYGVEQVLTPQERFDSEALLALPELQNMQGKKVMIFRGVGGRELLAETLKNRGATITFAESYQRTNPQKDCQPLTQLYSENKLQGIVVTSSEAMQYLIELAADTEWLKDIPIFVNHVRIAEKPQSLSLTVQVAQTAGDEAMLQTLITTLSAQGSRK